MPAERRRTGSASLEPYGRPLATSTGAATRVFALLRGTRERDELCQNDGFAQEVTAARARFSSSAVPCAVMTMMHAVWVAAYAAELLGCLEAVRVGHRNLHEDHVGLPHGRYRQRLGARSYTHHGVAALLKQKGKQSRASS
jgi:hypothetical protein